jgi:hypothetical protein
MADTDEYFMKLRDALRVDLWYPRCDDRPKHVIVGLVDVRVGEDIRISYDFDRDGWSIEQDQCTAGDQEEHEDEWVEVAFVGKLDPDEKLDAAERARRFDAEAERFRGALRVLRDARTDEELERARGYADKLLNAKDEP